MRAHRSMAWSAGRGAETRNPSSARPLCGARIRSPSPDVRSGIAGHSGRRPHRADLQKQPPRREPTSPAAGPAPAPRPSDDASMHSEGRRRPGEQAGSRPQNPQSVPKHRPVPAAAQSPVTGITVRGDRPGQDPAVRAAAKNRSLLRAYRPTMSDFSPAIAPSTCPFSFAGTWNWSRISVRYLTLLSQSDSLMCRPVCAVFRSGLQPGNRSQHLPLLLRGDLELVENLGQVLDALVPIRLADVQAGVRRLHVSAGVLAGAAAGDTEKVKDVLADAGLRSVTQAGKEAAELRIGGQPGEKFVRDGSQGVVAAQALVEALLRGGCRGLRSPRIGRGHRRKRHQAEVEKQGQSLHWSMLLNSEGR